MRHVSAKSEADSTTLYLESFGKGGRRGRTNVPRSPLVCTKHSKLAGHDQLDNSHHALYSTYERTRLPCADAKASSVKDRGWERRKIKRDDFDPTNIYLSRSSPETINLPRIIRQGSPWWVRICWPNTRTRSIWFTSHSCEETKALLGTRINGDFSSPGVDAAFRRHFFPDTVCLVVSSLRRSALSL